MAQTQQLRIVSWLLRIGLALTFLYASIAAIVAPLEWAGFLPSFLTLRVDPQLLIHGFSAFQILLSLWLLSGWKLHWSSVLCALTIAGIMATSLEQLIVTFRDFGLLFAAVALYFTDHKE